MTEESGLSEGRRPRLLEAARPERAEAPSPGRVASGALDLQGVWGLLAKVLFTYTAYFLISLNYLLNIL